MLRNYRKGGVGRRREIRREGERGRLRGGAPSVSPSPAHPTFPPLGVSFHYPLPGLVFEERLDERVQGVNVPGLVDEVDSSEASRKAVLGREEKHTQG